MAYNDITALSPINRIWVSTSGSATGDGTEGNPFNSIQAAVNAATPGTAIMVKAGTYTENVKLPATGGTDTAPLWLLSADGQGSAKIQAANPAEPVIKALGTDNVMIDGFTISGGYNGIQFSQSGNDFTNMVQNVVISNNTILDSKFDGVKISQADNVLVTHNTIDGAGDQGIDFVAVNDSKMTHNDISDITGVAGVFAKGGSTNVEISGNHVHHVAVDGIEVGGWTQQQYFRPGYTEYEASNVVVKDNLVEDVGKRTVNVIASTQTSITGNTLIANAKYFSTVNVESGYVKNTSLKLSSDIDISGNNFSRADRLLSLDKNNGANIQFHDNATNGSAASVSIDAGVTSGGDAAAKALAATLSAFQIAGTDGADTIKGSIGADEIHAGAGNDSLTGGLGNDKLYGEAGDDAFYRAMGEGADTIDGGTGLDKLVVTTTGWTQDIVLNISDTSAVTGLSDGTRIVNVDQINIWGDQAALHVTGGAMADFLIGSVKADYLDGGGGADKIVGGSDDTLLGGAGDDKLEVTGTHFRVDGGSGIDTLTVSGTTVFDAGSVVNVETVIAKGGAVVDVSALTAGAIVTADAAATSGISVAGTAFADGFVGSDSADTLFGGGGNDSLKAKGGNDVIYGGDGNDVIVGGAGSDSIAGGAGTDTAIYEMNRRDYAYAKVNSDTVRITDLKTDHAVDVVSGVELFSFKDGTVSFADLVANAPTVSPLSDLTSIITGVISGILGTGTASGASASSGSAPSSGGASSSSSTSSSSSSTSSTSSSSTAGAAGAATSSDKTAPVAEKTQPEKTQPAPEKVVAPDLHPGNDILYKTMGVGALALDGGGGNDKLVLTADKWAGDIGLDLSAPAASHTLGDGTTVTNVEQLTLYGGKGALAVTGGAFADILVGGEKADSLAGGGGDDKLVGASNDTLSGGEGNDRLEITGSHFKIDGGAGTDTLLVSGQTTFDAGSMTGIEKVLAAGGATIDLTALGMGVVVTADAGAGSGVAFKGTGFADGFVGTAFDDVFSGGGGNDSAKTGAGNDSLFGGEGNDVLAGGAGSDLIDGGTGTDTAVYELGRASYAVQKVDDHTVKIIDLATDHAIDTVTNVEQFAFKDGTIAFNALFA